MCSLSPPIESHEMEVSTWIGEASALSRSRLVDSALIGWIMLMSSFRLRFSACAKVDSSEEDEEDDAALLLLLLLVLL